MKGRLFLAGMLGIILTFGVVLVGCKDDDGGGDGGGGKTCNEINDCTTGDEYCGRSGCDAYYYENCDC
ncbi:MAG: hypothetical protein LBG05_10315 [Treponema sp.]|jgi:hypothetical protein|nr:hypothetical protein [Treponema sp.]